jgi:hypothetical protein
MHKPIESPCYVSYKQAYGWGEGETTMYPFISNNACK